MEIIIRKANVSDVPRMTELINFYADQQMMLKKSLYKIYTTIQTFFVAEFQGKIIGCVALSILWSDLGEVCSLAVDKEFLGKGVGRKLVESCMDEAKVMHLPRLISLTYQDKFFEKLGFKLAEKNLFPRKLWRECLECPKLEKCDELAYVIDIAL